MTIPRGWTGIEEQRDPGQQAAVAEPAATDNRFKAAAFFLFLAWLVICFSLRHSIHHYKPRNRGIFNSSIGFLKYMPVKFLITLPLTLLVISYAAVCAFDFSVSPLKLGGNNRWIYGMGFTPIALIILIQEIFGYLDPNEDRELIRQRRIRGAEIDAEMGYTKKPSWWSRLHGDQYLSVTDTITKNVREVAGRREGITEQSIEMGALPISPQRGHPENITSNRYGSSVPESVRIGASLLFPAPSGSIAKQSDPFADPKERGRLGSERTTTATRGTSERSASTTSGTTLNAPPQKIRSMLDV